jgi:hypothetical protein
MEVAMSKKVLYAAIAFLIAAAPIWAEIEVGVGIAPPMSQNDGAPASQGVLGDMILSLHAGYSFLWLFYASADALVVPPTAVVNLTKQVDNAGFVKDGLYRPGLLNLFDIGIRPRLGPIALMAEVGLNQLYIYKQKELPNDYQPPQLGVNLRLGVYWFLAKNLAVVASGTGVFGSVDELKGFINAVSGSDPYMRQKTIEVFTNNLYPTIGLTLAF